MFDPLDITVVEKIVADCNLSLAEWVTLQELTYHINDCARCAVHAARTQPNVREVLTASPKQRRKLEAIRRSAEALANELRELSSRTAVMDAVSVELQAGERYYGVYGRAGQTLRHLNIWVKICTDALAGLRRSVPLVMNEETPKQREMCAGWLGELVRRKDQQGITLFYLYLVLTWATGGGIRATVDIDGIASGPMLKTAIALLQAWGFSEALTEEMVRSHFRRAKDTAEQLGMQLPLLNLRGGAAPQR
jgi:hypothetical protein